MQKNVVMVHIETLPQLLFWQYQAQMPNLWHLQQKSLYFTRCFASGSSTIFTYNSIAYGSVAGLDHLGAYESGGHEPAVDGKSWFEELHDHHNYQTVQVFATGYMPPQLEQISASTMKGFDEIIVQKINACWREELDTRLRKVKDDRPLCLYFHIFCDNIHSCLPFSFFRKNIAADLAETYSLMMKNQDDVFGELLHLCSARGWLEDSLIAVYGDHGSDLSKELGLPEFRRGLYVYGHSAWVPLYIYNSTLGSGITDRLTSLDDLPFILSPLLIPKGPHFKPRMAFSGFDSTKVKREYVVTQNKYALQNDKARKNETTKAYAISDGQYRLIATNTDVISHSGGMELFMEQSDPGAQFDLLTLFDVDGDGCIHGISADMIRNMRVHTLPLLLNPVSLVNTANRYEWLRKNLMWYVREKEKRALLHPCSGPYTMSDSSFTLPAAGWENGNSGSGQHTFAMGIQKLIDKKRPVVLFGYVRTINLIKAVLDYYGLVILGFMDNNEHVLGLNADMEELPMYSPSTVAKKFPDAIAIGCVNSETRNAELINQCTELGLEYYSFIKDLLGAALV